MPKHRIRADKAQIADDCYIGPGVDIEADEVIIGPGCRIGTSGEDDFRTPRGVRIRVERLELGTGVHIGRSVRIEGGSIQLGDAVRVARHASLRVLDRLKIGAHGAVGEFAEIAGRRVEIGQELWMLPYAKIGGGSAFEHASRLTAGHYLHLGLQSFVNTARPVQIGHEVGLGTRTAIYTHGAYPSRLMGFPVAFDGVSIGDFTWIPGATINPGVRIGRNCVIGVNSLVTTDVPDGALAGGSPARVIREGAYPRPLDEEERRAFWKAFLAGYREILGRGRLRTDGRSFVLDAEGTAYVARDGLEEPWSDMAGERRVLVVGAPDGVPPEAGWTVFDTHSRHIRGAADGMSARFTNELRRYGIRFYSRPRGTRYSDWLRSAPQLDPINAPPA